MVYVPFAVFRVLFFCSPILLLHKKRRLFCHHSTFYHVKKDDYFAIIGHFAMLGLYKVYISCTVLGVLFFYSPMVLRHKKRPIFCRHWTFCHVRFVVKPNLVKCAVPMVLLHKKDDYFAIIGRFAMLDFYKVYVPRAVLGV